MKINLRKILVCSIVVTCMAIGVPCMIDSVKAQNIEVILVHNPHKRQPRHRHRRPYRSERRIIQYVYPPPVTFVPPVVYVPQRRCVNKRVGWCHTHYRYEKRCY